MLTILDQPHELLLGTFVLESATPPDAPWVCSTLASTGFGDPVPIIEFIENTLLSEGSEGVVTGWGNRTFSVFIEITAPDGQAMAQAENALFGIVYAAVKPPLWWTPPMVGAWTVAFDVASIEFVRKYDTDHGFDERFHLIRTFELKFTTAPFVRDTAPIVVPALAPVATVVDIDTCDSTSGWSQSSQGYGPTTRTNLMSNPSFEVDTSGWSAGGNAASVERWDLAASGIGNRAGTYGMLTRQAAGTYPTRCYANSPALAASAGQKYVIQVRLFGSLGNVGFLTRFYSGVNGTGSVLLEADTGIPKPGGSSLVDVTATHIAPAGTLSMRIFPYGTGESASSFFADAVLIEQSEAANGYFDGDTPDTALWVYAWTGTPHASTSTATSTTPPPDLTTSGGHVDVLATRALAYSGSRSLTLTRTAATALGGMPYLRVSAMVTGNGTLAALSGFKIDGVTVSPVFVGASAIAGYSDYYFALTGDFNTLSLTASAPTDGGGVTDDQISVAHIAATDGFGPVDAQGFQLARVITIEGSAPTGADITLDAGAGPLAGSTALIYTGPSPVISLRSLDQGVPPGFVADATMMSGARSNLNVTGAVPSWVPVSRLSESFYDLLARLKFTGAAVVSWSARLVAADGTDIPGSDDVKSGEVLLRNDTTDPWKIHTIAEVELPIRKIKGASPHLVEVKMWMATGGAAVEVDERWLIDQAGAVTVVHEPSAFQLQTIEISSPQLGAPRYEIDGTWIGYGTQSIIDLTQLGRHRFEPGPLHIFTATDLAKYAACSLRYYRKYPHHPGPALPALPASG